PRHFCEGALMLQQPQDRRRLLADLGAEELARLVRFGSGLGGRRHLPSSRSPLPGSKTCASAARGLSDTTSPCFGAFRTSIRATSFVVAPVRSAVQKTNASA